MSPRPEILLFGGAFNPFHNGHLQVAQAVHQRWPEIPMRLLVSWHANDAQRTDQHLTDHHRPLDRPQRSGSERADSAVAETEASDENPAGRRLALYHRINMLLEMERTFPFFRLELCEIVVGLHSTFHSLDWMRSCLGCDRPGFIIGGDQFMKLHLWHNYLALLPMAVWLVVPRRAEMPTADQVQQQKARLASDGGCIEWIDAEIDPISSTDIRQRIQNTQSVADAVPAPIADYLNRHQPYRTFEHNRPT